MRFKCRVEVSLKPGLSDPEGETTKNALINLGYRVGKVRVSKVYELVLEAPSLSEAKKLTEEICNRLLANPTKDDYRFEVRKL
ncbi:phosphoribosylformylglycinamidine synthase subunit PurS [Candidatus Bathyarchaeota archaeon]|nr:phosphoribosylformylglycinamidine synthase subunit PurS [Candidatus Bathyarchaeota archaeon]